MAGKELCEKQYTPHTMMQTRINVQMYASHSAAATTFVEMMRW